MRESSNLYMYRINFSLEMKPNGVRERSARRVGARAPARIYIGESKLTNAKWNMQQILTTSICKACEELENASESQKRKIKEKLLRVLALRSTYPEFPRAKGKIRGTD